MPFKNKTALITGSTSGIGFGIAERFTKDGMNIVMNGFGDAKDIADKKKKLEGFGVKVVYHQADMTKPAEIADMIATTIKEFGGIDVLVNNAGIQHVSPVESFPPEKWEQIIAINLSSSFYTVRATMPFMKKKGWGRIINIASAHGLVASPFKSAYIAAKHGIVGFTKAIALETAELGITCNAICPGYVLTPLVQNQISDTAKARNMPEEDVIKNVMLVAQRTKKFITIEQVAGLALFLCSDDAENITGAAIPIDGGWTAA